jgi:glycosyltransferase involved in cell wall biosynthesis
LNISIGILAYNEAVTITETLQSLSQQTLFTNESLDLNLEIVVVPNGCTDDTASVSQKSLEELSQHAVSPKVSCKVCAVEQPGKSNAWNRYVHEFSDPAADYLILMDADIQFLNPNTLQLLVKALEAAPQAIASVDTPLKDVALKPNKSLIEWLSTAVSKQADYSGDRVPAICGQLYCARAHQLREIWMPIGLTVEDGFLRAVLATDGFTNSEQTIPRIVHAKDAFHVFEAYIGISHLLRHERRQVVGNTVNAILFGYLWANCHAGQTAGALIQRNNQQDPDWLKNLFQDAIAKSGSWIVPKDFVFRRFNLLQNLPLFKKILRLPIALIAFFVDLWVCWQANQILRSGGGLGYWTNRS